jgi:hypothetical protein
MMRRQLAVEFPAVQHELPAASWPQLDMRSVHHAPDRDIAALQP